MSAGNLQSILIIAIVSGIFLSPLQTAYTTVPSSLEDNPCELKRKCLHNPILYHNYQKCIVCTGQKLTTFPKGLDPEQLASAVELRKNNLSVIHTSDFTNFSRLCYLDLSVNTITTLHDSWAHNLSRLQYLYLSNNKLESIRNGTFTGLNRMQYLYLDGNLITELPSYAFGQLPQLQVVHLQQNRLQMLSGYAFFGLKQLRKLNLGDNLLRILLPDSMAGLEILNELILSGNVFSEVPISSIASLVGLQHLRLDRNMIVTLPRSAFTNLRELIELTVALNNITTLQDEWCDGLRMLQYINISHNKVEDLSEDTFRSCPNVVIIDFSYNHVKGVPASILKPLQNHHAVDLHCNNLTLLPRLDIANDSLVTDIRLGGNPLDCDCYISWLKEGMDSGRISEITLSPDELFLKRHYAELNKASSFLDAECNKPDILSGMLIRFIPTENFTCISATSPLIHPSSVLPDLTSGGQYSITDTIKTSTLANDAVQVGFDVKMGIIAFLAVLSLVLMIILVFVFFNRQVCRWREQIYFHISEPPLPARYRNVGHKRVADASKEIDDSTSVMLLDLQNEDSENKQIQINLETVNTPKPPNFFGESELHVFGPPENHENQDHHFCNTNNIISSTCGKQWSVRVHSPQKDLSCSLYHDAMQSSCNLHGHFGVCKPATELQRYHQALEREATASLARGVILDHIRQCCTSHESSNTIPRIGKESFTGKAQTKSHEILLQNHPQAHTSRVGDIGMTSHKEHHFHPACHDSSSNFPVKKDNTMRSLSSSELAKYFTSEDTSPVVAYHEGTFSKHKYQGLSCPVGEWTSVGCLQEPPIVTRMDRTSMRRSHHRRSLSAREHRRTRKQTLSHVVPYRQRSWHGNRPFAQQHIHCEEKSNDLEDRGSRHMQRPPAPLPRPEATLKKANHPDQEQLAHPFTNNGSMEKGMIYSESKGCKVPFRENEHGEESLYFEPIE